MVDHTRWRVGDSVTVDDIAELRVIAAHHDERCSTYALLSNNGEFYRYAPPLPLHHHI